MRDGNGQSYALGQWFLWPCCITCDNQPGHSRARLVGYERLLRRRSPLLQPMCPLPDRPMPSRPRPACAPEQVRPQLRQNVKTALPGSLTSRTSSCGLTLPRNLDTLTTVSGLPKRAPPSPTPASAPQTHIRIPSTASSTAGSGTPNSERTPPTRDSEDRLTAPAGVSSRTPRAHPHARATQPEPRPGSADRPEWGSAHLRCQPSARSHRSRKARRSQAGSERPYATEPRPQCPGRRDRRRRPSTHFQRTAPAPPHNGDLTPAT